LERLPKKGEKKAGGTALYTRIKKRMRAMRGGKKKFNDFPEGSRRAKKKRKRVKG